MNVYYIKNALLNYDLLSTEVLILLPPMKLIAFDITNLTDARYYAARGANMLGFSTALSSVEEVNAMKEWVDVPAFFLRLPTDATPDLIWEWTERTGINSFLMEQASDHLRALFPKATWMSPFLPDLDHEEYSTFFIEVPDLGSWNDLYKSELNNSSSDPFVASYIIFDSNQDFIQLELEHISGVAIQGTAEDKVGLKEFDQIDKFLDAIEIDY